ncbi:pathogenicity island 2 effector protein SseB [Symbiopectobacterium purcellii]|uniref:Pathogenicity island 2 effector protein SseB n=1 Tax=Symbiopectobacterium purcellii TaxID=2871826 RepID=A0ABX9AJM6_9ENTR|nr:pathogenicity island 2 effector protein SseB [Symbiopectobacterium purcellii]QZN95374.1 pathogenicity island 2 effector protein SseB [Symbiopectobacterium purcellii]
MENSPVSSLSGINSTVVEDKEKRVGNTSQETAHYYGSADNIFAYAYEVMLLLQDVQLSRAYAQFNDIQNASNRARDTQEKANQMDEVIAQASKGDGNTKEAVPAEVIDYMKTHGIQVDGKSIEDYIKQHADADGKLDKGSLQAVKAALDNSANRDSDLSSQAQLTIQKAIQMLNAAISQATNLVSKWGEILQMITQKTYS